MTLKERMQNGMLFYEHGHKDPVDIQQEKELEAERRRCKEIMFDYNSTRPSEDEKRKEILKGILGDCGDHVFIENPVHMSYGSHVHLGEHFYANFNLVIVDDMDVYIGNRVMIGPNVTIHHHRPSGISPVPGTGGPLFPSDSYRRQRLDRSQLRDPSRRDHRRQFRGGRGQHRHQGHPRQCGGRGQSLPCDASHHRERPGIAISAT